MGVHFTQSSEMLLLSTCFLLMMVSAQNPGDDLAACINDNGVLNECLQLSVANMGDKYKRGVPELGLPSLDPMTMPMIEIEMGNNKVKMEDKYTVEVLGKSSGPYRSRLRNMV